MNVSIHDSILRDGNHAISHSLGLKDIIAYCKAVDSYGLDVVEVGHGDGLGASSLQPGIAKHTDCEVLDTARSHLTHAKALHAQKKSSTVDSKLHALS